MFLRFIYFIFILTILALDLNAQCCSAGTSNPMAGGTSQDALAGNMMDLNLNNLYTYSDKFFTGNKPTHNKYFDSFSSLYNYFRVGYGLSRAFTISIEAGYYTFKKELGLNNDSLRTYKSNGFSDLIIFPRYKIYGNSNQKHKIDIVLGLGYKIPLGSYNDSTKFVEPFSKEIYYVVNPQAVQMTTGAQDVIFSTYLNYGNNNKKFNISSNLVYIRKGWNPRGEKVGNFASIGLIGSKTITKFLDAMIQLRYENAKSTKVNKTVSDYSFLNYDPEFTGYEKIFISPQLNFKFDKFRFFTLWDIPIYQYMIKTQVGSTTQFTAGIAYTFAFPGHSKALCEIGDYNCPMHPQFKSNFKAKCPLCNMEMVEDRN